MGIVTDSCSNIGYSKWIPASVAVIHYLVCHLAHGNMSVTDRKHGMARKLVIQQQLW